MHHLNDERSFQTDEIGVIGHGIHKAYVGNVGESFLGCSKTAWWHAHAASGRHTVMTDNEPTARKAETGDGSRHANGARSYATSRRKVLSALGAGLLAPGAFSRLGEGRTITSIEDEYDTVVDIVADGGADDTGGESITPILREHCGDDTLIKFPPGTYYMDEQFRFTGFRNFGLVGDDATIVPANYHDFDGPQYRLFRLGIYYSPGTDLRFEGFTVDMTAEDTGVRVIEAQVNDGLNVRNVDVVGQHDAGTFGPALFDVMDPDGSGHVYGFRAPDGGAYSVNCPGDIWRGPTGILMSDSHRGTITYEDCVLGAFPDNGLYALTNGQVIVDGGTYENSQASSIRLGGTDCVVRGATVRVDEARSSDTNQRGIRLDSGSNLRVEGTSIELVEPNGHAISVMNDVSSARIENTSISIGNTVTHGIVISPEAGPTDIVDTAIEINGGGNAIQIQGSNAGKVVCEHVDITGNASGSDWRHAIKCYRDDCEFRSVNIDQTGPHYRRGIELNGDGCLVYSGTQTTRHHPIVVNGASAWIEGITAESVDGYAAVKLTDASSDATVKRNTLYNGILDKGCAGLRAYGNDTPSN